MSPSPAHSRPACRPRGRRAARLLLACGLGVARWAAAAPVDAPLPDAVAAALARSGIPSRAFSLWVQPVDAGPPVASWNARQPMNPASVFKLYTTTAALDLLGPAFTWRTPVYFTGPVVEGRLRGSLVIRGRGDPSLVLERAWLLLRHVRDLGVQTIEGDIVLDHSAFAPATRAPGDFDGQPAEPYNVLPDALLLNFKAVTLQFVPDPARGVAHVVARPALQGVRTDATVRLVDGPCDDWRARLRIDTADGSRWHAAGGYPTACGERSWPLAYADPARYDARFVAAMWQELGGGLGGAVRDGATPADLKPAFEFESPPLANIVRDVNKYSNNVMAEQIWLTLGMQARRPASEEAPGARGAPSAPVRRTPAGASASLPSGDPSADEPVEGDSAPPVRTESQTSAEAARAALRQWVRDRLGAQGEPVIVNGSGLARETRVDAQSLARLLQWAWRSPVMPELLASLPILGVDGTLRRATAAPARAHLKTGSMRDVLAVAGVVLGADDRRYVLVALVNDPRAAFARPVMDAAIQWTQQLGTAAAADQKR